MNQQNRSLACNYKIKNIVIFTVNSNKHYQELPKLSHIFCFAKLIRSVFLFSLDFCIFPVLTITLNSKKVKTKWRKESIAVGWILSIIVFKATRKNNTIPLFVIYVHQYGTLIIYRIPILQYNDTNIILNSSS